MAEMTVPEALDRMCRMLAEAQAKACGHLLARIEVLEAQVKSLQMQAPRGTPSAPPSSADEGQK